MTDAEHWVEQWRAEVAAASAPVLTAEQIVAARVAGKCDACGHAESSHNDLDYCQARSKRWGECQCGLWQNPPVGGYVRYLQRLAIEQGRLPVKTPS